MGKNVILAEQTVRELLEAYASLAAWYYQLWAAVRSANGTAEPPSDAARAAFIERLALDYPELAAVARTVPVPKNFVPPPPALAAPLGDLDKGAEEPATLIEPAPARLREMRVSDPPPPAVVAPPPLVAPGSVRYSR
jgi:hypothetical protein